MSSPRIRLEKVDPDNAVQVAELRRQRDLTGWDSDKVDMWLEMIKSGGKGLYWILPAQGARFELPEIEYRYTDRSVGPPPPNASFRPLGHISVDWEDSHSPPLTELASRAARRMYLGSFFILVSQQCRGLGSESMRLAEKVALEAGAVELTLETMQAKDQTSKRFWERLGVADPPATVIKEEWYRRLGFVPFRTDVPVELVQDRDGQPFWMTSVLMKKKLASRTGGATPLDDAA